MTTRRALAATAALSSTAVLAVTAPPAAALPKLCGQITVSNIVYHLTTKEVTCRQARRVLRKANRRPDSRHEGFRCVYKTVDGDVLVTCRKPGKQILATYARTAGDLG